MFQYITLVVRKTNGGHKKVRLIKERGPYCARCGVFCEDSDSFTLDHIIPSFMGLHGSHYRNDNNLQIVCIRCQHIKCLLEHSLRDRIRSGKNMYLLLMGPYTTPLEAALAEQEHGLGKIPIISK